MTMPHDSRTAITIPTAMRATARPQAVRVEVNAKKSHLRRTALVRSTTASGRVNVFGITRDRGHGISVDDGSRVDAIVSGVAYQCYNGADRWMRRWVT
jgi:hypothetical protein